MPNYIQKISDFFNKIFNLRALPPSQSEKFLAEFLNGHLLDDFESSIDATLNLPAIKKYYSKALTSEGEKDFYNFPLQTKLSPSNTLELAKQFLLSLGPEISKKALSVLDDKSDKFNFIFEEYGKSLDSKGNPRESEVAFSDGKYEVYCPIRGDLRDLYNIIHELTHTFDLKNNDTEARKIFGEIAPQCTERLLDNFLKTQSENYLQKYEIHKDTLQQDINYRNMSTFLSRIDNLHSLLYKAQDNPNHDSSKIKDLRYILAQIYSSVFVQLSHKEQISELAKLMTSIEQNDINSCKKTFGIPLDKSLRREFIMPEIFDEIAESANKLHTKIVIQDTLTEIIEKAKNGKNFVQEFGNQNIHVNLDSKVPFILITPSHPKDDQTLVMETNNLETNNAQNLLLQALDTGKSLNNILKGDAPILIPILPSPYKDSPYYQQLSAECFENGERPDLDIVEAINKAKEIMQSEYNVKLHDKIFLNGYSTSGCFAQRFALIHPELVDYLCVGGAIGSIPIPSDNYNYPLGVLNFEELFGKKFNIYEYGKIHMKYYVGKMEGEIFSENNYDENGYPAPMHDMSYFPRSVPPLTGEIYRNNFGQDMFERYKNAIKWYVEHGMDVDGLVFSDIAHNDSEAHKIMDMYSFNKNIKGIHAVQGPIISTAYNSMLEYQKSPYYNEITNFKLGFDFNPVDLYKRQIEELVKFSRVYGKNSQQKKVTEILSKSRNTESEEELKSLLEDISKISEYVKYKSEISLTKKLVYGGYYSITEANEIAENTHHKLLTGQGEPKIIKFDKRDGNR